MGFLGKLAALSGLTGREAAFVPAVPPGQRVYAIGDVHGRDDLLEELLQRIEGDHRARPPAQIALIMLGDLIDRGPGSCEVLQRLSQPLGFVDDVRMLRGNHEECALNVYDGDREGLFPWLRFGGEAMLRSYSVIVTDADNHQTIRDKYVAALPRAHLNLLRAMLPYVVIGDYLFVHAGIRPGVPLDKQRPRDLYWIREPFLTSELAHGHMVVHGHTISDTVEERANRIGIDTGAYASERLTAIGLEGTDRWFISTGPATEKRVDGNDPIEMS